MDNVIDKCGIVIYRYGEEIVFRITPFGFLMLSLFTDSKSYQQYECDIAPEDALEDFIYRIECDMIASDTIIRKNTF